MAFITLLTLLPLSALLHSAHGIGNFGLPLGAANAFGGNLFNNGYTNRFAGANSLTAGINNYGAQARQRRPILTMTTTSRTGDHLSLTFEEDDDNHNNPVSPLGLFGLTGGPFGGQLPGVPGLGLGRRKSVRAVGVFVGAPVGSPGGLKGTFNVAITEFGNTKGDCIAVGRAYVPRAMRQRGRPGLPLGGFGNIFGGPLGQNPFLSSRKPQTQLAVLSVPIQAAGHSFIHATVNVGIDELPGRAVAICAEGSCQSFTNVCGEIVRDQMTVEEFAQFKRTRQVLATAGTQLGSIDFRDDDDSPFDNNLPVNLPGNLNTGTDFNTFPDF